MITFIRFFINVYKKQSTSFVFPITFLSHKSKQASTACFLILFALFAQIVPAQVLLPYLAKNGLYGLADESGKVVLPAKFSQMMGPLVPHPIYENRHFYIDGVPVSKSLISTDETIDWIWDRDANDVLYRKLQQLIYANENCNLMIYQLGTNKSVEICLKCPNNNNPERTRIDGYVRPCPYPFNPYRFKHGFAPIIRPNDLMNFVDTSLNQIFTDDFPDGAILDETYFCLENSEYKCALGDRSGHIRTDFKWDNITSSKRKGFFLVNHPNDNNFFWGKIGLRMGLIDANGRTIIEPIYDELTSETDKLLRFRDSTGVGMMDYDGNIVLPTRKGNLQHAIGDIFIRSEGNQQYYLENQKGEKLLPTSFYELNYVHNKHGIEMPEPFFAYRISQKHGIILPNLQEILQDSVVWDKETFFYLNKHTYFLNNKRVGNKTLWGLIDYAGRTVLKQEYDDIQTCNGSIFKVKKNENYGLFAPDGSEILPCKYEEIRIEGEFGQPNFSLTAHETGSELWKVFEKQGQSHVVKSKVSKKEEIYVDNVPRVVKENGKQLFYLNANLVLEQPLVIQQHHNIIYKLHCVNASDTFTINNILSYPVWLPKQQQFFITTYIPDPQKSGYSIHLSTWVTVEGKLIAPLHFSKCPLELNAQNIVQIYENGIKSWAIINEKAEKIADYTDLDDINYFGVEKGLITASKDGKWGLIDSIGKVIVPFQYDELYNIAGKLLIEKVKPNEIQRLLNWQGEVLAIFGYQGSSSVLPSSYIVVSLEMYNTEKMYVLLLSPEGKVIKKIEKSQYLGSIDIKGQENYIKLVDDMDRIFLVDVKNGIEFREQ
jgi:WG containing repeat